ncbi:MAG: hypothetical protein R3D70_19210 [Rhizobiaceae bacterium]
MAEEVSDLARAAFVGAFVDVTLAAVFFEFGELAVLGPLAGALLPCALAVFGVSSFFSEAPAAFDAARVGFFASFVDLAKTFLPKRGFAYHDACFSTLTVASPACVHMYGVKPLKAQAVVVMAAGLWPRSFLIAQWKQD